MKRFTVSLAAALALAVATLPALAHDEHHMAGMKTVTKSVQGEVVDMGCYLGHAAVGDKHSACGNKCLAQGMPMGLLTPNGTLYLVTMNHDDSTPFDHMKSMAGKQVVVTGELLERSGMKAIEATAVKLAAK